jgi:hypothetical protein
MLPHIEPRKKTLYVGLAVISILRARNRSVRKKFGNWIMKFRFLAIRQGNIFAESGFLAFVESGRNR